MKIINIFGLTKFSGVQLVFRYGPSPAINQKLEVLDLVND